MPMTEAKCRRFTALFDTDGNGVIQRDEFIEFAQFLTVMNFLTNTEEGQSVCPSGDFHIARSEVNLQAEQAVQQSLKTDAMLELLEQDPDMLAEVLPHLPKPLYWDRSSDSTSFKGAPFSEELTSLEFNKAAMTFHCWE